MKKAVFLIALASFLVWGGVRVYRAIRFDMDCSGYLKRAADANIAELAERELAQVITYLEANNITTGYTSVIYRTPDEDIGFWYSNLLSAANELRRLPDSATTLEKSNALMKLRETILDGEKITEPQGISLFPHNTAFFIWGWLSFLVTGAFVVVFMIRYDGY